MQQKIPLIGFDIVNLIYSRLKSSLIVGNHDTRVLLPAFLNPAVKLRFQSDILHRLNKIIDRLILISL